MRKKADGFDVGSGVGIFVAINIKSTFTIKISISDHISVRIIALRNVCLGEAKMRTALLFKSEE